MKITVNGDTYKTLKALSQRTELDIPTLSQMACILAEEGLVDRNGNSLVPERGTGPFPKFNEVEREYSIELEKPTYAFVARLAVGLGMVPQDVYASLMLTATKKLEGLRPLRGREYTNIARWHAILASPK